MWQLFQFPLCPFSRKVRLVLAEKGIGHELVRENPWEKRDRQNVLELVPRFVGEQLGRGRPIADCHRRFFQH